jgi:hypothetical protein
MRRKSRMKKEVLEALSRGIQEDFADKLEAEETILIHSINGLINILTELKRKDLPHSFKERLWRELPLKYNYIFECRGKINAYGYAKNLSSVLKKNGGSEVTEDGRTQMNIRVGDSILTHELKRFTVKKILANSVITEENEEISCGDIISVDKKERENDE